MLEEAIMRVEENKTEGEEKGRSRGGGGRRGCEKKDIELETF